jgi:hypothetical protein
MKSISLEGNDAGIEMVPIPSTSYSNSKPDSLLETIPSTVVDFHVNTNFNPTTSLQIQAAGKRVISFPSPPKQLETPIFSPDTGRPVYISIRPRRRKGNCRLVLAEDSFETAVARTTYKWGPSQNPIVRIGRDDDLDADEFEMVRKSLLCRTVDFKTRRWGKFQWRYGSKSERAQYAADNLLILEKVGGDGVEKVRVAQLVRNGVLRTPGTNYLAAGNGGRLQMDLVGEKGHELVDEVTVVVTCLVMLKKEIDRLRAIQIASMSTGGGSPALGCAMDSFARVKSRFKS